MKRAPKVLWSIIEEIDSVWVLCKCECGTVRRVSRAGLKRGSRSCGCIKRIPRVTGSLSKKQSRGKIQRFVLKGILPKPGTLFCNYCGNPHDELHHYAGYGKNWNKVEPICRSCHNRIEVRKPRGKFIGPLTKVGGKFSWAVRGFRYREV